MDKKDKLITLLVIVIVIFGVILLIQDLKIKYISIKDASERCSMIVNQTQNELVQQCNQVISQLQGQQKQPQSQTQQQPNQQPQPSQ